jgi:outer membrane protein OmpA-like peptidoglycan-associated protein
MRIMPSAILLLALSSCAGFLGQAPEKTYVVFFTEQSTTLDSAALKVIADAATQARAKPAETVVVLGYTDSRGSASADQVLSSQRADVVASALVSDGVASANIRREGRGQTHNDPGLESRRVEIAIGE